MSPDSVAVDAAVWGELGQAIRHRRRDRGLTLVALAASTSLSQPFLSQVENGRARPSMGSLHRIAQALATTPQALFAAPSASAGPVVARHREVAALPIEPDPVGAVAVDAVLRLLLPGDAPFHVLEFDGLPGDFRDHWSHDGFEAVYVVAGEVEVEVDGEVTHLGTGDVLSYSARLPHRHRSVGPGVARLLLIETKVETVQDKRPSSHAPARRKAGRRQYS